MLAGMAQGATLRLRLLFDDRLVFGPGKAELLARIEETGSIAAAGRAMGMSYKRAWALVEEMNAAFRAPLVSSARGGAGNVFYFRPGHETYPTYHQPLVQQVIANAVRWAHNPEARLVNPTDAPNRPVAKALEPIVERGPRLHHDGEAGYR